MRRGEIINKYIVFILIIILIIVLLACPSASAQVNVLMNPSFEEIADGNSVGWQTVVWNKEPNATEFSVESGNACAGERCISIVNNVPNDARYMQTVKVEGNTIYKISCCVRTEEVGEHGTGACISFYGRFTSSHDIKGTTVGWETIELFIKTGTDVESIVLTLGLGGYSAVNTGIAHFDNVSMEKVTTVPEGVTPVLIESVSGIAQTDMAQVSNNSKAQRNSEPPSTFLWVLVGLAIAVVIAGILFYIFRIMPSLGRNK